LIASSIVTGIVFSHNVTDSGMQMIGRILTAVSDPHARPDGVRPHAQDAEVNYSSRAF
jgi:hypothetical protein